ncbi:uncharacterized protein [Eurosta solidaginis]|uniref:uncharacterized protein n=1 Tax=Eurosta solidaginis TaxID=178769 RepID=UPI003530C037
MFDEGSSITLLEENIANQLGLRGRTMPLTLQWYGESQVKEQSREVSVAIKGSTTEFYLKKVHTVKSLNLPNQTFDKQLFAHLQSLPIKSYTNVKPVLLLGLDNSYLGIGDSTVEAGPKQPIATATRLGWVVYGPRQHKQVSQPRVLHVRQSQSLHELHRLVQEHYSVENFGVRSTNVVMESDDDRRARAILQNTTKEIGKKYEVGLLWRSDTTILPPSYDMACHRLKNLETRMLKDASFAERYKNEIDAYISKGYARPLRQEERLKSRPTTWYLPHFGVVNPHKPNKLRIVFDAAAATSNVSLNSVLLKGPDHAKPLIAIIHKFRQGVVAVAADIQEMFSQVKIRDDDQSSQRFLWRNGDPTKPIQTYVMSSMIFGAICSPCCAEFVKNTNAARFKSTMPQGSAAVIHNMYVDDLVISFNDPTEAEKVVKEAIVISLAAGFKLRNFLSNDKALQSILCGDIETPMTFVNMEHEPTVDKVLGMFWNTHTDSFEFHIKFHKIARDVLSGNRPPTKRELLGIVMAIYDIFGLLANVTIYMKLLLQPLWKCQTQWDDPLPQQLNHQWISWWESFQNVSSFSVPRCYSPVLMSADKIQLHVFVDASSSAYAAVAYLRMCKDSTLDVAFVAAKARCAPLKGMTVPRLELQAAVLGCRLSKSVQDCHEFNIDKIVYWSDSK